jgi:KAP-like P-loop domain-containing protein
MLVADNFGEDEGMATLQANDRRPGADGAPALDVYSDSVPELLSDLPIREEAEDHLGYGAYAEALAELIDSPSVATPLTLSIDAPWGAGKTSLARLVERKVHEWPKVRGDRPHIVCWFNAWMHSDAAGLGPALAAAAGKAAARDRSVWRRLSRPMPAAILSPEERKRRRALLLASAVLIALIVVFVPPMLRSIFSQSTFSVSARTGGFIGAGVLAGVSVAASLWTSVLGAAQATATFVGNPQSQAATGSMADVAEQFAKLVLSATRGRRRLVIFVDDLDRCPPERALQVCETTSLLLAVPDVVTVLIGDVAALRDYARERFSPSAQTSRTNGHQTADLTMAQDYGRSYFDKIVQLDFSLPPPDSPSLARMLSDRSTKPTGDGRGSVPASGKRPRRRRLPSTHRMRKLRLPGWLVRLYSLICGRPRRFAAFVGITFALWTAVAVIVTIVDPHYANHPNNGGSALVGAWGGISFLIWFAAGIGTAIQWLANRRTRRSTVKIDETIRGAVASPGEASVETIKRMVERSIKSASSSLIEQRTRRAKVEQLVNEGSGELMRYLPGLPRSVKRVVNRHYLLASVAVSREMVGGTPPLTPQHLSKWAVLMERWPELAAQIVARPTLACELEQLARSPERSDHAMLLGRLPAGIAQRDDLIRLLEDAVSFGAVTDRLAFALPAGQ